MGNNEVLGPFGPGGVVGSFSPNLSLIRASAGVKRTRTGQLLDAALHSGRRQRGHAAGWHGMVMFLDCQIRQGDPRLESVYAHFERNLEDICSLGREAGVPVLVCTIGTNFRDSAPFASLHRSDLTAEEQTRWENLYQAGQAQEADGHFDQAIGSYEQTATIDDEFADLHYRLGRCREAVHDYDGAFREYVLARDRDSLRFRADSRINDIIRTVAGNQEKDGIYLVDTEKRLIEVSAHGLPGEDLFYEHVHPHFTGNYQLARSIFEQITNLLPASGPGESSAPSLSEEACARQLAFMPWHRSQGMERILGLLAQPPFANQLDHDQRLARWRQRWRDLLPVVQPKALHADLAIHEQALAQRPEDWIIRKNLAHLLTMVGETNQAADQWARVVEQVPHAADPHQQLALILAKLGKWDEALAEGELALEADSEMARADTQIALGSIWSERGRPQEALAHYREALRIDPEDSRAHFNIGVLMEKQRQPVQAVAAYGQALEVRPDYAEAHFNLANLLAGRRQLDEAIEHLTQAVRINPDFASAHTNLGALLAEKGDLQGAQDHYLTALRSNPELAIAHFNLAAILEKKGMRGQAKSHYHEALRLRPGWREAQVGYERLRSEE
jgi:tetratricopeptide (TPR) repeat protein